MDGAALIVKKAIVVNVKLTSAGSSAPRASSGKKPTSENIADGANISDIKQKSAVNADHREMLEQILEQERESRKLAIKIVGFSQSADGSVKLKLKLAGQAEIAEDFAALSEKAITDIFRSRADDLKPFELISVNSSG